ncbi:MAG: ribonuclease [Clostridia bacterium]|nr:ribonuclease [Clostridia bacterium]
MRFKRITALLLAFLAVFVFSACSRFKTKSSQQNASPSATLSPTASEAPASKQKEDKAKIDENGVYDSKDDVALYIHTYGRLPKNYISKKEAEALGWQGGSLNEYAPGKCIGGDRFGNYEGLLPKKNGRKYQECDIDTLGKKKRGTKRIIYSNDGLIYYTDDHYESFTLLYGDEQK